MESLQNQVLKSIYFFNDYIYEMDIINGNNVIAINTDDEVFVCGLNQTGGLGLGHKKPVNTLLHNPDLSKIGLVQFYLGHECMFARNEQDEIYCWGDNDSGQFGMGELDHKAKDVKPIKNTLLTGKSIVRICCGREESAFLTQNGVVYFWIHSSSIGENVCEPVQIRKFARPGSIIMLDNGLYHFMAVDQDNNLLMWGRNIFGQLGCDNQNVRFTKEPIVIDHTGKDIVQICCGGLSSYYLTDDKCVYFCGKTLTVEENGICFFIKLDFEAIIDLISIQTYVLAISEYHVYELGKCDIRFIRTSSPDYDSYLCQEYQVTNNTLDYSKYSVQQMADKQTALDMLKMFPDNMKKMIKRVCVFDDTKGKNILYVTNEDEVYVTGSNENCILGDGTDETLSLHYKIDELSQINIEHFYQSKICMFARTKQDEIYCWGKNYFGLLGQGYATEPGEYISALMKMTQDRELHKYFPHLKPAINPYLSHKGVKHLYCYENTNFALTSSGQLYGWGFNMQWKNNAPSYTSVYTTPTLIEFNFDIKIVKFAAGLNHYMALDDQGRLHGWGSNHWHQLKRSNPLFLPLAEIVHSNVQDMECILNKSFILTNYGYLLILGEGTRYLNISSFELASEMKINMVHINPSKELVLSSDNVVYELVHRGYYKKTIHKNVQDYLKDKFSDALGEYQKYVQDQNQRVRIQFDSMMDCELTSLVNFENKLDGGMTMEKSNLIDNQGHYKAFFKCGNSFHTFDKLECIGRGSYGKVYKIRDHLSGRIFALKYIPIKGECERSNEIFNEIRILSKLESVNIVKYYTGNIRANFLQIKMEYCECYDLNTLSDLVNIMKNSDQQDEAIISALKYFSSIKIMQEIAEGIIFLHTRTPQIVHGDLKPNNIFLKKTGDTFIKIGDFGLANFKNLEIDVLEVNNIHRYLAPELFHHGSFSVKSDIYAFGMIGSELIQDSLFEEKVLSKLVLEEPSQRIECNEFQRISDEFISKYEHVRFSFKNIQADFIEKKLNCEFLFEYLLCKLNLDRKSIRKSEDEHNTILSRTFRKIGAGAFADVYKVKDKLDEQVYAIKVLNEKAINLNMKEDLKREIQILSELSDESLVQYKSCWFEYNKLHIQMEFCQFNLAHLIHNKRIFFGRILQIDDDEDEIDFIDLHELSICLEIFSQITRSLRTLHDLKIIHRDLKPENVLVKISAKVIFKISDFGFSKYLDKSENTPTLGKNIGTNKYESPELARSKKYNFKSDIYSLGKILLDILDIPFEGEVPDDLEFGNESTELHQDDIIELIKVMTIEDDFNSRPDCNEILERVNKLMINWDVVKTSSYYGLNEKIINDLANLELDDTYIKILMNSENTSILSVKTPFNKIVPRSNNRRLKTSNSASTYDNTYDELELLRTGGFGFVFKVKHKHDEHFYAIKKYYLGSLTISSREQRLVELRRFAKIENIHIAQYKISWLEKNVIYNQMELCDLFFGEILARKLEIFQRDKGQAMSTTEYFVMYELFREWVEALDFLHEQDPPLTSGKLNRPLISLNHPHHFLRLIDIQTRQSSEASNILLFADLKDIGQILRNAPYIFDFDLDTKNSTSIQASAILNDKHDQLKELIFYERNVYKNTNDQKQFPIKVIEQAQLRMNQRGDERTFEDMIFYSKSLEISMKSSDMTTGKILGILDELMINEQQLRQSSDFPIVVSHLNVKEDIVYKIFEGKLRNRFNCEL